MCGIAGYQGGFDRDLLHRMLSVISHRGPDGEGVEFFPPTKYRPATGLGHRRLAILDLSAAGRQPMGVSCTVCGHDRPEALLITYNGEVYNFPALRKELEARGHEFRSATDTEVILHLYAEEGPDCLARLNGIFALALLDDRVRGRASGINRGDLLLARDPIGVKPLYMSAADNGFLFASEIKALLQYRELSRELDLRALQQTLAYLWTPAPRTMLRSVQKVKPGTAVLVRGGGVVRHWIFSDLPAEATAPNVGYLRGDDAIEQVRVTLAQAVERQMVSDVPVGAFLSGGLDSSGVVAMMCRAHPDKRPVCFSVGFQEDGPVEGAPQDLPYARQVARHLNVELREITAEPTMINRLEEMLWLLDEPQADPAPLNALLIAEAARSEGIPVLLSGAGGDDLFTGYRRHDALMLERRWAWLPRTLRRGLAAGARSVESLPGFTRIHALRRVAKAFRYADLPAERRLISYFWWSDPGLRRGLYSPGVADELARADEAEPLLDTLSSLPARATSLERMMALELRHFLIDHNLNYTDRMGMAAGVEVRVPLVDLELVRLAARIPPSLKHRRGEGKYILRAALAPFLPQSVVRRPKSGFGAPLRRWLRGELRPYVQEVLDSGSLKRRGLFDPDAVKLLVRADRAGRLDGAYTIFSILCIELWCRLFVDEVAPRR